MDVIVDVADVEKLTADLLREERQEIKKRVNKAVGFGIDWLHGRAVTDAPVGATGALKASITKDPGTAGYSRRVFLTGKGQPVKTNGGRHGFFQEFGTSRHAPQPFLMIHASTAGDKVAEELGRQIAEVLK